MRKILSRAYTVYLKNDSMIVPTLTYSQDSHHLIERIRPTNFNCTESTFWTESQMQNFMSELDDQSHSESKRIAVLTQAIMEKALVDLRSQPRFIASFLEQRAKNLWLYLNLKLGTDKVKQILLHRDLDFRHVIITLGSLTRQLRVDSGRAGRVLQSAGRVGQSGSGLQLQKPHVLRVRLSRNSSAQKPEADVHFCSLAPTVRDIRGGLGRLPGALEVAGGRTEVGRSPHNFGLCDCHPVQRVFGY